MGLRLVSRLRARTGLLYCQNLGGHFGEFFLGPPRPTTNASAYVTGIFQDILGIFEDIFGTFLEGLVLDG
jgi:hypothetical protein